jgi:acyl-CoA reductase-like NAD-dependent aldehyde dehydrogenase
MTTQATPGATPDRIALNWIDSQWRDSADHADSFDPATGEKIGHFAVGGDAKAREAVAAALEYKHIVLQPGIVASR